MQMRWAGISRDDYDKALDRAMTLSDVRLEEKSGGRSGVFRHPRS